MPKTPAVLCVCLGNICRSPLAEAALRHAATEAGVDMKIDSAGTGDWHLGRAPDPRSIAVAKKHGIDISGFKARLVETDDFYNFTHIIVMDKSNLANVQALAPKDATAEIFMLLGDAEVPDPYYGPDSGFDETWEQVNAGARAFLARV